MPASRGCQPQLGYTGKSLALGLVDWRLALWQNVLAVGERHPRIARESKTVAVMIDIYCRSQHGGDRPCADCSDLLIYATERLDQCPFQEGKTTCAKCPVHCFKPAMRDKIKTVMRYSGPRMIHKHPILAMRHFIDRSRKEPIRSDKRVADRSSE
jgi:Nitrous oxide-stimulated promoter